jgi:hypothetical protein
VFLSSEFQFKQFACNISCFCWLYCNNSFYPLSVAVRMTVATLNVKLLPSAGNLKFSAIGSRFSPGIYFVLIARVTIYGGYSTLKRVMLKQTN